MGLSVLFRNAPPRPKPWVSKISPSLVISRNEEGTLTVQRKGQGPQPGVSHTLPRTSATPGEEMDGAMDLPLQAPHQDLVGLNSEVSNFWLAEKAGLDGRFKGRAGSRRSEHRDLIPLSPDAAGCRLGRATILGGV